MISEVSPFLLSLSLRQQEAGAAAAGPGSDGKSIGFCRVSSPWQPLEQLPVRWPRVLIDFIASVQC